LCRIRKKKQENKRYIAMPEVSHDGDYEDYYLLGCYLVESAEVCQCFVGTYCLGPQGQIVRLAGKQ
jgi:hypothetical protein